MIGIALIGCGYWGSILKRYIEQNRRFKLIQVCNSKSDLTTVFNDPEVKAVVVATPVETHYCLVKTALQHNKHVLSEKPLALKTSECLELSQLASANNLVLQTNYVYAFSVALQKAKDVIESGKLGKMLSVELSVKHLGRFEGLNVYWLLASHMLSVLGTLQPLSDFKFSFHELIKNETASILFSGPFTGRIDISLNYPWKQTEINFYCEHGTIRYDPNVLETLKIVHYEKPSWTVASLIPKEEVICRISESHNLRLVFDAFADLIDGNGVCNLQLAIDVTQVLEQCQ
jgi:predicted dehydrogenase